MTPRRTETGQQNLNNDENSIARDIFIMHSILTPKEKAHKIFLFETIERNCVMFCPFLKHLRSSTNLKRSTLKSKNKC